MERDIRSTRTSGQKGRSVLSDKDRFRHAPRASESVLSDKETFLAAPHARSGEPSHRIQEMGEGQSRRGVSKPNK